MLYVPRETHIHGGRKLEPLVQVTDEWRLEVLAWLEAVGWNRQRLARELGAGPDMVMDLLRPFADGGLQSSRYVHHIVRLSERIAADGGPPPIGYPLARPAAEEDMALLERINALDPETREWVRRLVDEPETLRRFLDLATRLSGR